MGLEDKALVVARDVIFQNGHWQGIKMDNLDYYIDLINKNYTFLLRSDIEENPSWQQIIPYIVFKHKDNYFVYRYLKKASEQRLKNDYLLGIGGHIDPVDSNGQDVIETGMMREWEEEIDYRGQLLQHKLIGILNDETRPVEAVHLGLVYLFEGDSPDIRIKEKDVLAGKLVPFKKLGNYVENTNGWAPIVYQQYLVNYHN